MHGVQLGAQTGRHVARMSAASRSLDLSLSSFIWVTLDVCLLIKDQWVLACSCMHTSAGPT